MTQTITVPGQPSTNAALREKHDALARSLRAMGRVMVAFSGGVDSALLLKVAADVLGDDALGVTAVSPSLPVAAREETARLAAEIGARHLIIETHEVERADYRANDAMRCYFCKDELYTTLSAYAREHGFSAILDGTNIDDRGDHRPGRKAAREFGVCSPLAEVGFTKGDVRTLARQLRLSVWNKPAAACLSSRVPYGTPVTPEVLRQIDRAEAALHALGFEAVRVRHHGDVARVEVPPERLPDALARREAVVEAVRGAGYTFVALDLEGYRTGSLNEVLKLKLSEAGTTNNTNDANLVIRG